MLNEEKSEIDQIICENRTIKNKKQLADKLNSFFVKSVEEINNKIPFETYKNLIDINSETLYV